MTKTFSKIRLIFIALIVTVSFCGVGQLNTYIASAAGSLSGWANRIQLTINHTYVTSALSNFPVMIHLSSSSGTNAANVSAVFTALGNNSQKIAVTTADGTTQLYVEINSWDSASKQAILYAKVPSVSSTANTVLYLYYDNSHANNTGYVGSTGSTAAKNVWDSSYVGVYHESQQAAGTAGEFKDSTSRGYNGQGAKTGSASYPTRTTGVVKGSYAQLFSGTASYGNFIKIPDENAFSQTTTGYLTISFWANPTTFNFTASGSSGFIRFLGKQSTSSVEWQARIYNSNPGDTYSYPGTVCIYGYNLSGGLGAGAGLNKQGSNPAGQWSYYTFLFTPTSITAWLNAPPYTTWSTSLPYTKRTVTYSSMGIKMGNGTAPVSIGAGSAVSNLGYFSGKIGEVRFSNSARSEAWITASFYSDKDCLISYNAS